MASPSTGSPLRINVRAYDASALPIVTTFLWTLPIGSERLPILGPSSQKRGYVIELSPPNAGTNNGAFVEAKIIPQFNGTEWIDTIWLNARDAQSTRVTVRIRRIGGS
jgi:hypothetical protein